MNEKNSNQVGQGKTCEGWDSKKLSNEASQKDGDESKGNADECDVVGSVEKDETAHGREEAKNDIKGKANANG